MKPKYVFYINISDLTKQKAEEYIASCKESVYDCDTYDQEQWYFIPVRGQPTRIEIISL